MTRLSTISLVELFAVVLLSDVAMIFVKIRIYSNVAAFTTFLAGSTCETEALTFSLNFSTARHVGQVERLSHKFLFTTMDEFSFVGTPHLTTTPENVNKVSRFCALRILLR